MTRLEVNLPGYGYPVIIGEDVLANPPDELVKSCLNRKTVIVTDETVYGLYGRYLEDVLRKCGVTELFTVVIKPGEGSKSFGNLEWLCRELFRNGMNREGRVIALGGGVIGDLAGFTAAIYMRGVQYIQIPTTLLAQVDSGVGGKVAVNLGEGKNLIGNFYQPQMVLADTGVLSTLPVREWKAGMAEVIKYAAIAEPELLPLIENPESGQNGTREVIERVIYLCCKCKADFVERDEHDTSVRMLLNFGHTFGHAIEKLYNYEGYNHGEAVALGMLMAARTGTRMGVTVPETEQSLRTMLEAHGIETEIKSRIGDLVPLMQGDKKNTMGSIKLILLREIGDAFVHKMTAGELAELLEGEF